MTRQSDRRAEALAEDEFVCYRCGAFIGSTTRNGRPWCLVCDAERAPASPGPQKNHLTVWIVAGDDFEDQAVRGVFSTEEAAYEHPEANKPYMTVFAWVVDVGEVRQLGWNDAEACRLLVKAALS